MTFRRRLAVLAASSLLLAGCAVPGQEAAPGVVAEYRDAEVTAADVDAIAAAWDADSDGAAVPDRLTIATYAVMGPALLEAAAERDIVIGEGDAETIARAWFEFAGVEDPEVSSEVVESIRPLLAMYVLAFDDPTFASIIDIAAGAEAEGVFSPRVGEFTTDALLVSLQAAIGDAEAAQLGNYSFVTFLDVSGFTDSSAPWAARG